MTSGIGFVTDTEVFRKDNRIILANNRHLATIIPVKLAYDAAGYYVGQVLARNTTSGQYQKYVSNGSSGTDTAAAILFNDVVDMPASGTDMGQAIVKGNVFYAKCTGIDADAVTDLNGRTVTDGSGNVILIF